MGQILPSARDMQPLFKGCHLTVDLSDSNRGQWSYSYPTEENWAQIQQWCMCVCMYRQNLAWYSHHIKRDFNALNIMT